MTPKYLNNTSQFTTRSSKPLGMTLIELMVVIAILGLLTVTVLPNISGTLDRTRGRESIRASSSFIARSQSRAFGATEPRGVMIQPIHDAGTSSAFALDLFFVNVPPAYSGDSMTSVVNLAPLSPDSVKPGFRPLRIEGSEGQLSFLSSGIADATTSTRLVHASGFCKEGDSIQFGGLGPWFKFVPAGSPYKAYGNDRNTTFHAVEMWDEQNQTPFNAVLPRGSQMAFKIRRQPSRASVGTFQFQNNVAIDLKYCMLGGRMFSDFIDLGANEYPISILYDSAGRPFEIVHSGGVREAISEPVFLLVGLTVLCGNVPLAVPDTAVSAEPDLREGANWQYADAVWMSIDHQSGVLKTAPSSPRKANAAWVSNPSASQVGKMVALSQYNIRIESGL